MFDSFSIDGFTCWSPRLIHILFLDICVHVCVCLVMNTEHKCLWRQEECISSLRFGVRWLLRTELGFPRRALLTAKALTQPPQTCMTSHERIF